MPSILFDVNIDNRPAYEVVLVDPVAKFDKKYLHWRHNFI